VCWTAVADGNRAAECAGRRTWTATGRPSVLDGGRGRQQGGRVCSTADVDSNRAAAFARRRTQSSDVRGSAELAGHMPSLSAASGHSTPGRLPLP